MVHQSSAVQDVKGAHRFSFFAFEVAMLIPRGDLDVQHAAQSQRVVGLVRLWGWAGKLDVKCTTSPLQRT